VVVRVLSPHLWECDRILLLDSHLWSELILVRSFFFFLGYVSFLESVILGC